MNPIKFVLHQSHLSGLLILALFLSLGNSASADIIKPKTGPVYTESQLQNITPTSPNPYLSLMTKDTVPDYDYWDSVGYWKRMNRPESAAPRATKVMDEDEPNNVFSEATLVTDFTPGTFNRVLINASFSGFSFIHTTVHEDNGSIPLAVDTGITLGDVTAVNTFLGDGPFGSNGSGSGDYDFYKTGLVGKDALIQVTTHGLIDESTVIFVSIWSESGDLLYGDFTSYSSLTYQADEEGYYYICVGSYSYYGLFKSYPRDPFESGSGYGVATEGHYTLTMAISDLDIFKFDLEAGDVIGFSAGVGTPPLSMKLLKEEFGYFDTMVGTEFNVSYIYPDASPLYTNDDIHAAYVIAEPGTYYLTIAGTEYDDYVADLRVYRPPLETSSVQRIYITFGGDWSGNADDGFQKAGLIVVPSIWLDDFVPPGPAFISPLYDFLEPMGLETEIDLDENYLPGPDYADSDYAQLLDAIETTLMQKMPNMEANEVEIIFDEVRPESDTVSSVVYVMGSQYEIGLPNIGLLGVAESIDPGNFESSETAIVLLDVIVADSTREGLVVAENAELVDLIGDLISDTVAHELGHYIGSYHVNSENTIYNVMDHYYYTDRASGGDGIWGTNDDPILRFGKDQYSPGEVFTGTEDTLAITFWGFGGGQLLMIDMNELFVNYNQGVNGIGTQVNPFNQAYDAVSVINPGGTINIEPGSGNDTFVAGDSIDTPMTLKKTDGAGVVRIGE